MSGLHDQPDGAATPLSPEERDGLIPAHVTLREELNEVEAQNILAASLWAFERKRPLITVDFSRNLHKRMYNKVWQWAGDYRTTNKNIGVDANQIFPRLYEAMEQFQYWLEHQTFPADEIAVRFHHTLVAIHPFPNGNGRWSRLMADLLVVKLGQSRFTWGRANLAQQGNDRDIYIAALKTADNHDIRPLLAFARS